MISQQYIGGNLYRFRYARTEHVNRVQFSNKEPGKVAAMNGLQIRGVLVTIRVLVLCLGFVLFCFMCILNDAV